MGRGWRPLTLPIRRGGRMDFVKPAPCGTKRSKRSDNIVATSSTVCASHVISFSVCTLGYTCEKRFSTAERGGSLSARNSPPDTARQPCAASGALPLRARTICCGPSMVCKQNRAGQQDGASPSPPSPICACVGGTEASAWVVAGRSRAWVIAAGGVKRVGACTVARSRRTVRAWPALSTAPVSGGMGGCV